MKDRFIFIIQMRIKRIVDFTVALIILIVNFPLLFLIGVIIKLDSPGPVLFRHSRIGKDGKPFMLYKFRTMFSGGDETGYINYLRELIESTKDNPDGGKPYTKMKNDCRVTRVGHFLRNYYLDELPQMLNILKGELSLVGPRPHVQFEVDHYTPEQRRRLTVPPGATGLWQVAGKADCTFSELLEYDLQYIDNWSLNLDLQIVLATVSIMFGGGEKLWTRKSKRFPIRRQAGIQQIPHPIDSAKSEDAETKKRNWRITEIATSIGRYIPFLGRGN